MKLPELAAAIGAETVYDSGEADNIRNGYTSDLLSDVMANAKENSILITIQAHRNTVAVASLVGAKAILVCNNRAVPEDMLEASRQEKIAVLKTKENQFESSHLVYQAIQAK